MNDEFVTLSSTSRSSCLTPSSLMSLSLSQTWLYVSHFFWSFFFCPFLSQNVGISGEIELILMGLSSREVSTPR